MSLTRRVYGGRKSRNSKKGRGHCRIGGKKTLKKGGKRVLSLGGKSLKNRKKSKRRSKGGGYTCWCVGHDGLDDCFCGWKM